MQYLFFIYGCTFDFIVHVLCALVLNHNLKHVCAKKTLKLLSNINDILDKCVSLGKKTILKVILEQN